MPSIAVTEFESPEKINKKTKKSTTSDMEVDLSSVEKKVKKEKKSSKKSKLEESEVEKKEKKRKVSDEEEELEAGEPMNSKKKKMRMEELVDELEEEVVEEDPNAVKNFRISSPLKAALKSKGIEALFPIQAMTFNNVLDGHDLVGRARTGQVVFSYIFGSFFDQVMFSLSLVTLSTVVFELVNAHLWID